MPKKGLYVSLFEGQQNPDEQQHGEGSAGPVFGPFEFVEVANGTQINMGTEAGHDELTITSQGLVYYDGFYYGDLGVVFERQSDSRLARHRKFDQTRAVAPHREPSDYPA